MGDSIKLTRQQIDYLIEMLEINTPEKAVERFVELMTMEGADPIDTYLYLSRIMKRTKQ